jgi:hypothetical protein
MFTVHEHVFILLREIQHGYHRKLQIMKGHELGATGTYKLPN